MNSVILKAVHMFSLSYSMLPLLDTSLLAAVLVMDRAASATAQEMAAKVPSISFLPRHLADEELTSVASEITGNEDETSNSSEAEVAVQTTTDHCHAWYNPLRYISGCEPRPVAPVEEALPGQELAIDPAALTTDVPQIAAEIVPVVLNQPKEEVDKPENPPLVEGEGPTLKVENNEPSDLSAETSNKVECGDAENEASEECATKDEDDTNVETPVVVAASGENNDEIATEVSEETAQEVAVEGDEDNDSDETENIEISTTSSGSSALEFKWSAFLFVAIAMI